VLLSVCFNNFEVLIPPFMLLSFLS